MTTDEERLRIDGYTRRYFAAAHAMQSATAAQIGRMGLNAAGADPKHLRTGLNSAFVGGNALAALLIRKGIIADVEHAEALAVAMEEEAERLAKDTREKLGLPDTVIFG